MPFVKRHRTYYKYGTEPNATIVGSLTIDEGVVSGFSSANYVTTPKVFNPSAGYNWEIIVKFTTGSDLSTKQMVFDNTAAEYYGIGLFIHSSKIFISAGSGGSWTIDQAGVTTLLPNTTYWFKGVYDGSSYAFYLSTNKIDWNEEIKVNSSKPLNSSSVIAFGYSVRTKFTFNGSVDLAECNIVWDNKNWWHGTKAVKTPSSSITDFGSYKYFKNVVTTKYWKEITTGSKELEYACYSSETIIGFQYYYAKMPFGNKSEYYRHSSNASNLVANSSELGPFSQVKSVISSNDTLVINDALGGTKTCNRYTAGDLYIDTTVTETVEGTPEDYTYTTEEITPVEVSADDEYDYTEFVPSTEFDYYEDKNKLYNLIKRHRTYYKYDYKDWTQPVLTSNTSYGVLTASAEGRAAWQALDGNTSTNWEIGATTTGWLNWKLPKKIKITGMKIRSRTGDRPILTCRCYTDSSKTVAIGDSITTTASGQEIVVANIPVEGIITDNIYFDCSSTQDYLGISDVVITAQEQVAGVELNINGFDIYQDWEQPVLTANTTTVKGGNIVVTCSSEYGADWFGYKSMDGTDTTNWATAARVYSGWLKVVFPYKLKISNLNIKSRGANTFEVYDAENGNLITSGGAESKNTPIDYPVNNVLTDTLYFKVSGEETVGLQEVKITAQKLVSIGASIEDADYYTDRNIPYNIMLKR